VVQTLFPICLKKKSTFGWKSNFQGIFAIGWGNIESVREFGARVRKKSFKCCRKDISSSLIAIPDLFKVVNSALMYSV